jgi:hypothetical protein
MNYDASRLAIQSARIAGVHPYRRAVSGGRSAGQAAKASALLFFIRLPLTLPCRAADAYHTAYCLSGLSSAQHHVYPSPTRRAEIRAAWNGEDGVRATAFAEALSWAEEDGGSHVVGSAANRVVCCISPCFVRLVAKGVTECHTSSFQSYHHPHRGYHGTFL